MNILSKSILVISLFAVILPLSSSASCDAQIKRTLSKGSKGADVKVLQKFLNDSPLTLIAKSGVNSKGNENGIFDNATKNAVMVFQKTNSDLILKPAGLKNPNGIFGLNGRNIINNILCIESGKGDSAATMSEEMKKFEKSMNEAKISLGIIDKGVTDKIASTKASSNLILSSLKSLKDKMDLFSKDKITTDEFAKEVSTEMNNTTAGTVNSKVVKIESIMPFIPKLGEKIYIFGDNFSKENKVFIGEKSFAANLVNTADRFVTVDIPTNFIVGSYDLYISNSNGKSDKVKLQITTDSSQSSLSPKISQITPTSGNIGTTINIIGSGFTKNNTIYTTTKSFLRNVSADGKTLKIKIDADKGLTNDEGKLFKGLPFSIFIRNENGDSNMMDFKIE